MSVEYSGQLSALDFLGSVVTPLMTTAEREALHVNLTEQLGLVPIPTPTPSPFRRRLPWWQPVFGLATAAAVVAAIVILPGTLTGGSSDNASFDLASAEPESTDVDQTQTTAAAAADGVQEAAPLDARALDDDAEIAVHETDTVSLEDLLKQTLTPSIAASMSSPMISLTGSSRDVSSAQTPRTTRRSSILALTSVRVSKTDSVSYSRTALSWVMVRRAESSRALPR